MSSIQKEASRPAAAFAAVAIASLFFLVLPDQASAVWDCRLECTAAKRGITSFSCPGTPTEAVCGPGPSYTCFAGANDPCPDNHMMYCAQAGCPVSCNTSSYPCSGCTAASVTPGGACANPINGRYANGCPESCGCPSGTTLCGSTNTCVVNLTCPPGTTFDACSNSCTSPYILRNPQDTQSDASIDIDNDILAGGNISATGDLVSTDGDVYLNSGKAIRVDGLGPNADGITELNIGNWGDGGVSVDLRNYGRLMSLSGLYTTADRSEYPLEVKSYSFDPEEGGEENTAILNLADMSDGGLWTGVRLARGLDPDTSHPSGYSTLERWFIGMADGDDGLRLSAKVWDGEGYSDKSVNISDGGFYNGLQVSGEGTNPTYRGFLVAQSLSPLSCSPLGGCSPTDGWPWGEDGTVYYNAQLGKLRCLEDGEWKNCVMDGGLGGAGQGETGQVAIWQDGNGIFGTPELFWDDNNSRLGIGTDAPAAHLTVLSGGEYNDNVAYFEQTGAPDWYGDPFESSVLKLYRNLTSSSTGPNTGAILSIEDSGENGATGPLIEAVTDGYTHFVVTQYGGVGIGDASPSSTLTVGEGDRFQVSGATGFVGIGASPVAANAILVSMNLDTAGVNDYGIRADITSTSVDGSGTGGARFAATAGAGSQQGFISGVSGYGVNNNSVTPTNSIYGGTFNASSSAGTPMFAYGVMATSSGASTNYGILARPTSAVSQTAIAVYGDAGSGAGTKYAGVFMNGNVGIGTVAPAQMLDVVGTVQATGFKMPTGAAVGYSLTSDASGNASWQPGVGTINECTGGTYAGTTGTSYNGNLTSGGLLGYKAANALCAAAFAGSHLCTSEEMLRSVTCASTPTPAGTGWVAVGPPGYTSPAVNDCNGWKSNLATKYGAFWTANADGGVGGATSCDSLVPLHCCSK